MVSELESATACLIIIGNEILSGRTQDTNLAHLSGVLNELGIRMMEARVIPDVDETIVDTVNHCKQRFDYVFTTGALGQPMMTLRLIVSPRPLGWPLKSIRRLRH